MRKMRISRGVMVMMAVLAGGVPGGMAAAGAQEAAAYRSRGADGAETLDVQKMIDDAVKAGQPTVTLPAGRFRLATKSLGIGGVKDFTLEGAGPEKTVLVTGMLDGTAMNISGCQRITLRNFALDRDPVPYVQATITKISDSTPDGITMEFTVHDGYAPLTEQVLAGLGGCAEFFDHKTRRLGRFDHWFGPAPGKNVVRVDDKHGKLLLDSWWKQRAQVGDYVTLNPCRVPGAGGAMVFWGDDTVRVEGVTIYASGSLGIGARFLTGDNYFRYTIKPGPTPAGATQARLLATNADGMQYFWCPGAVTFEGCDLGYTGDDCIHISVPVNPRVKEVLSPTRFVMTEQTESYTAKNIQSLSAEGDIVRPEEYGTFRPRGDFPIKSLTYDGMKNPQAPAEAYFTVELQQAPADPVAVGDMVVCRKFEPAHFVIRNCHFHETRARGLLIMAPNGVIENNTIDRTALAAMNLVHEQRGGGGDWVSDLVVRNNTIRDVCFNAASLLVGAAAICMCNEPAAYPGRTPFYPWVAAHKNVSITGNTIDGCDTAGILICGLEGGEVRDNVIRHTNLSAGPMLSLFPGGWKLPVPYAITVMNSHGVRVEGNKVSDLGTHAQGAEGDVGTYPAEGN